jgi:hypothetical protein
VLLEIERHLLVAHLPQQRPDEEHANQREQRQREQNAKGQDQPWREPR